MNRNCKHIQGHIRTMWLFFKSQGLLTATSSAVQLTWEGVTFLSSQNCIVSLLGFVGSTHAHLEKTCPSRWVLILGIKAALRYFFSLIYTAQNSCIWLSYEHFLHFKTICIKWQRNGSIPWYFLTTKKSQKDRFTQLLTNVVQEDTQCFWQKDYLTQNKTCYSSNVPVYANVLMMGFIVMVYKAAANI